MTVAATDDPFADVLQSLKESLSSMQPLSAPLLSVRDVVGDVDQALVYAADVPATLTTCQEVLEALSALCEALIEVPFVDVLAEMAAGVMEDVVSFLEELQATVDSLIEEIVTPCKSLFNDLSAALTKAVDVITTITQTIPDYLNTVQIMSYCLDIAQQLLPFLSGTQAENSTKAFVSAMVTIRNDVASGLKPLAAFAQGLATVINDITKVLVGPAGQAIQSVLKVVKDGLGAFESIVDPVRHAFEAIENAIRPIKWVLDAVESLIKHILEPVVKAILDATGLSALLKPLIDKVESALGVKPLFDTLQQHCDSTTAGQWQQQGGSAPVGAAQTNWHAVAGALEQYNSREKGGTYKLIMATVDALTGSPVGPGPFPLPDWPIPPQIGTTQVASLDSRAGTLLGSAEGNHAAAVVSANGPITSIPNQLSRQVRRVARSRRLCSGFAAFSALADLDTNPGTREARMLTSANPALGSSTSSPPASPPTVAPDPIWITDQLSAASVIKTSYDDVGLPHVTQLLAAAAAAKQDLANAQTIGPTLATQLSLFAQARQLPADFQEEMGDFSDLLGDLEKLVVFLASFNFMPTLFKTLETELATQVSDASTAVSRSTGLVTTSSGVNQAIEAIELAFPGKSAFTAALQYIDQVAAGAASLGNVIRRSTALNIKLNGQFSARIQSGATLIDQDAAAALVQMQTIHGLVTDMMGRTQAIVTYMSGYAAGFTKLGQSASPVSSTALPGLEKGVRVCNTLASILDPLTGILVDLNCVAGSNPSVKMAGDAIHTFKDGLTAAASDPSHVSILQQTLGFLINKTVPTAVISADIDAIATFVAQEQSVFVTASQALLADLPKLSAAMTAQKNYPYKATVKFQADPAPQLVNGVLTGGGGMVTKQVNQTIPNLFVDANFQAQALQLTSDMNAAALAAGVPPDPPDLPALSA